MLAWVKCTQGAHKVFSLELHGHYVAHTWCRPLAFIMCNQVGAHQVEPMPHGHSTHWFTLVGCTLLAYVYVCICLEPKIYVLTKPLALGFHLTP